MYLLLLLPIARNIIHPSVRPLVETAILTVHWPHPLFSSIQFPLVSVRRRPRPGHWPVRYSLLKAPKTTAYNKVPPSELARYRPALTRLLSAGSRSPPRLPRAVLVCCNFLLPRSLSLFSLLLFGSCGRFRDGSFADAFSFGCVCLGGVLKLGRRIVSVFFPLFSFRRCCCCCCCLLFRVFFSLNRKGDWGIGRRRREE